MLIENARRMVMPTIVTAGSVLLGIHAESNLQNAPQLTAAEVGAMIVLNLASWYNHLRSAELISRLEQEVSDSKPIH